MKLPLHSRYVSSLFPKSSTTSTKSTPALAASKRSLYTSLQEVSYNTKFDCFAVTDDGYDASKYGYRVIVPAIPSQSKAVRNSSTMAHTLSAVEDYLEYMNNNKFVDPRSLDILSSPEVLEILHGDNQRENKFSKEVENPNFCLASASSLVEDPYFSDCEEMLDGWEDPLPSLDEKQM
jgi:hypothetical protein